MSGKSAELDPGYLFENSGVYNDAVAAVSAGTVDQAAGVQANGVGGAGYPGVLLSLEVGVTTGSPTSFTVTYRIQDSDDDVTYADVDGVSDVVISSESTKRAVGVNVRRMRPYVRWRRVVAFVGGSSPTVEVAHCMTFTRTA